MMKPYIYIFFSVSRVTLITKRTNMDVLPDDVVADVLGHLDPRSLAACRCVCKSWRATVDAGRLLRKDLLPLSVAGIFDLYMTGIGEELPPMFFARPASINNPPIDTDLLSYLHAAFFHDWAYSSEITGHCNGLLLLFAAVANPATRQWARLPPYPREDPRPNKAFYQHAFLAYDPTTAAPSQQHFEVFFMQCPFRTVSERRTRTELDPANPGLEWPPSPFVMSVFSSRTWRWEERSFVREGMGARHIASLVPFLEDVSRHDSVYWRGRLYVCHIFFIIRLDLEDNRYHVIQLPPMKEGEPCRKIDRYFGKSKNGVYYGFVQGWCKLQVWFLDESTQGTHEWVLKHDTDLEPFLSNFPWKHGDGPWSVQGYSVNAEDTLENEEKPEWDSDNDDGITASAAHDSVQKRFGIWILGFHPYKEIVFLHTTSGRVMAYHLNSSKAEDLGCLPLDRYDYVVRLGLPFTYTPCWMEISCLSLEAGVDRALGRL
ncbi:hypothetical protein BRADI_4g41628v3 [Brachypodium distachyon]|uniref:F-box domain-containing protein n=1 Tax=Brachypodium distachyon TaxID=15368 RepID=A0A2K2CTN3_BRADI|nr:hypothetical protein BRADI_4g41628v3 [Brachypodium distachyon]